MSAKNDWRRSIRPRIGEAQRRLLAIPAEDLARRSGFVLRGDRLEAHFFDMSIAVDLPSVVAHAADGSAIPEETQILLLDYLLTADGTVPGGRFVGFSELPGGGFYGEAFRSYSSARLIRRLDGDAAAFRSAAGKLGGEPLSLGDASFSFRALPHLALAAVWWNGDDEFPAEATVLFDQTGSLPLPIDGMAAIGRILCSRLVHCAARGREQLPRTMGRSRRRPMQEDGREAG